MAGTTEKNAVFFEVRASWIILGYFRIRMPELCQEEIVPTLPVLELSALGIMTMRHEAVICYFLFASDVS